MACNTWRIGENRKGIGHCGYRVGVLVNFDFYYTVRPFIPRWIQIELRRRITAWQYRRNRQCWPVSELAGAPPPFWPGWPQGKRFAVVLTHDIERANGVKHCEALASLEEERGFRSAVAFVPLRYETPEPLRRSLAGRGFEIMVHDLYHDGKLFRNWHTLTDRRRSIDEFLHRWETRGFCTGAMQHNLPWISHLDIDYSVSTYDVDPFEPHACGLGRIFPCCVHAPDSKTRGFIEMPYTLPQDFTAFVLLLQESNAIWRRKLDWIASQGGMALIKTHPDYMVFPGERKRIDGYPVELYTDFLDYLARRYGDEAWFAQPSEVARFWRGLCPPKTGGGAAIPFRETFCRTCREAHAAGWLNHYPTRGALARPAEFAEIAEQRKISGHIC